MSEEKEEKEEEIEFVIVRDEFSDSETDETQKAQSVTSSKARSFKSTVLPSLGGQSDTDSVSCNLELCRIKHLLMSSSNIIVLTGMFVFS